MHDLLNKRTFVSALNGLDIDAAGGALEVIWANPVDIYRIGFIAATSVTQSSAITIDVIKRVTVGSASGAVTLDTISPGAFVAGAGVYKNMVLPVAAVTGPTGADPFVEAGATLNVGPTGPIRIIPGQSLLLDVNQEATAGAVYAFVEYVERPFVGTDIAAMTEVEAV